MRDKLPDFLPLTLLLAMIAGLFFSRGMLSIAIALLFLWSFFQKPMVLKQKSLFLLMVPAIVFLLLTSVYFIFRASNTEISKDTEMALLWFVSSVALVQAAVSLNKQVKVTFLKALTVLVAVIAIISDINYFLHQDEINKLLLQSKHVPVFGGMHHIYFGMLSALLVIFYIGSWLLNMDTGAKWIYLFILIIFISMHILSSRTGLYAFYMIMPLLLVSSFFYLRNTRKKIWLIVISFAAMLVISTLFIPSFKNKVLNTQEDISATRQGGEEVNYKSMGMRLKAWQASLSIIKQHPLTGVGPGNAQTALQQQFNILAPELLTENRVGPHNQFLEFGIKFGIGGMLLLLCFFLWFIKPFHPLIISLTAFLGLTFCLESVLERQIGISITALFLFLVMFIKYDNKTTTVQS